MKEQSLNRAAYLDSLASELERCSHGQNLARAAELRKGAARLRSAISSPEQVAERIEASRIRVMGAV